MKPHWFALPALLAVLLLVTWQLAGTPAGSPIPAVRPAAADTLPCSGPPSGEPLSMPLEACPPVAGELAAPGEVVAPILSDAPTATPNARRECYESGSCKVLFDTYTITDPNAAGEGTIVEASRSARLDGPSYMLVGSLTGEVPKLVTLATVTDEAGGEVCQVMLMRMYYVDDNEDLPVEELGFSTTNETSENRCAKGDVVRWGGEQQVLHGLWQAWYEDGTCAAQGRYEHGKRDSEWLFWHRNGALRARGGFVEGTPDGEWNWWFDDGAQQGRCNTGKKPEWCVWTPTGEIDPCHDPEFLSKLDDLLQDYKRGHYERALAALDTLSQSYAEGVSDRQDTMVRLMRAWLNAASDSDSAIDPDTMLTALQMHISKPRPALPPETFAPVHFSDLDVHHGPVKDRDPNEP